MFKQFIKFGIALSCVSSLAMASEILAVVNGKNITDEVAPKNFKTLDKDMQQKIIHRLVQKRLACDYALSTDVAKSKEFIKVLEHVLFMNSDSSKETQKGFLAEVLKKDGSIKGYTKEQLYSKKGLLAFDFIVNKKAQDLKPTTKELKEYYENNRYKYDTPALKELLVIVVDTKQKAQDIIKTLKSSDDKQKKFRELAKKLSLAPSAEDGGYFGKIAKKELNSTLKPAVGELKRGEFTKQPIKTEFGYEVFFVLNDIPEFKSKFDLVKSKVENDMMQKRVKQWAMDTIKKLEDSAKIKIVYEK